MLLAVRRFNHGSTRRLEVVVDIRVRHRPPQPLLAICSLATVPKCHRAAEPGDRGMGTGGGGAAIRPDTRPCCQTTTAPTNKRMEVQFPAHETAGEPNGRVRY